MTIAPVPRSYIKQESVEAEKVLNASVRNPNRTVLMDVRVAQARVARGTFEYVETEEPKPKKKRTYTRRAMQAEG